MRFFYNATPKELLELRNKIILETAIPCLLENGFKKSPFSTSWFGRDNHRNFNYELCRLTGDSQLEILWIYIHRGERRTKFRLNIFELSPHVQSIDDLTGLDGIQFVIPPDSLTEMYLRSDDVKGPPLFSLRYMSGYKLKRFYTKGGLIRSANRLTATIKNDMNNINHFIRRWHELHHPMNTSWTGHEIKP